MQIPQRVWDQLLDHLKSELPREGVGVLLGSGTAVRYRKLQNVAHDETHFRLSPQEWVSLVHALEQTGERILAIVHSHPASPPEPSAEDMAGFAWPDAYMLIVSFHNPNWPQVRLYRKRGERLERCPVQIMH